MNETKFCFSCGHTKESDCFAHQMNSRPTPCKQCAAKIKASRRADKRKKSGEAMAELQAQQKLEREAKEGNYYKPKADRPVSNVRQHKVNLDNAEERAIQRKINEEIGDEH